MYDHPLAVLLHAFMVSQINPWNDAHGYTTFPTLLFLLLTVLIARPTTAQTTKAERRAAADAFNAAYGYQWIIRWDDRRGTPRSILGHTISSYYGTPEEIARAFLNDQKTMFGINDVPSELRLAKRHPSRHGSISLFFRQYHQDLPVVNGGYLVAVGLTHYDPITEVRYGRPELPPDVRFDPTTVYTFEMPDFTRPGDDWYLYFVNGDHFPDINVNTNPVLTSEDARRIAYQTASSLESLSEPDLSIYVEEPALTYLLVYHVEGRTGSGRPWEALIDAHSGAVVHQSTGGSGIGHLYEMAATFEAHAGNATNLFQGVSLRRATTTADADVYKTNQEHEGELTPKVLSRLTYNGDPEEVRLDGTWIKVERGDNEDEAVPTDTSPLEFIYTDEEHEFDEVMAYYHANDFRYWVYYMGMDWDHVPKTTITVAYQGSPPDDYALATPSSNIRFMTGYPAGGWNNPTHEGAIIVHEFAHLVSHKYNSKFSSGIGVEEDLALWEAYSDYFGIAWRHEQGCAGPTAECSVVGIYADPDGGAVLKRDIDANFDYDDDYGEDNDGDGNDGTRYDNSLIFSGALWALREEEGWIADYIVLKSLDLLVGETSLEFSDARDAVYDAADETYYVGPFQYYTCSTCQSTVNTVFNARSIPSGGGGGSKQASQTPQTDERPGRYHLYPNFPNPFNPSTAIRFDLPEAAKASLVVYDVLGRTVARLVDGPLEAGRHSVYWEARNVPSGTYIYRLSAGNVLKTRPMVLLK